MKHLFLLFFLLSISATNSVYAEGWCNEEGLILEKKYKMRYLHLRDQLQEMVRNGTVIRGSEFENPEYGELFEEYRRLERILAEINSCAHF